MRRNSTKTNTLNLTIPQEPNLHVSEGLFQDLLECTKYLRMHHLVEYMYDMGFHDAYAWTDSGDQVTMMDLESLYGQYAYASKVGPIHFSAGPHKAPNAPPHTLVVIKSNALNWCLDTILTKVNKEGCKVFDTLEIPL